MRGDLCFYRSRSEDIVLVWSGHFRFDFDHASSVHKLEASFRDTTVSRPENIEARLWNDVAVTVMFHEYGRSQKQGWLT